MSQGYVGRRFILFKLWGRRTMAGPIRSFIPHAFVRDVPASVAFYRKLGFKVSNSFAPEGEQEPSWCWLSSERGDLMLGKATEPVIADQQRVLFYGYCDDINDTHRDLSDAGLDPGPITTPFYNPGGEFRVTDPDGYVIWIAQI
jgi:catechol 2,3-dioxygenase-like lactoylglutathione lyase family enzyme